MNTGLTRNIDNSFSARPAFVEFVVAPFCLPRRSAAKGNCNREQDTAIRRGKQAPRRGYNFFLMGEAG
jgi:hypothetical protein